MRKLASVLVAALVAGLGTFAPGVAPAASAATQPKVAIIVGATHGTTPTYRTYANEVAATALKYTSNVVKVYSPNATWSKVKSAVNGASIIVYLGHGNGWPSPYTYDPNYTTKDGFGLNYDLNGDGKLSDYENKYYGEPSIRTLTPAPNAVVLLFHLCYASGNSEPGDAAPSSSVAKQRVDNYAAAFLKAGARAVIANGHSHSPYYIDALFTTRQTIDQYWRNAPDFHDNVRTYASSRSSGYTLQLDPESSTKYYRSIAGKLSLTTQQVTGASYASTSGDPATFVVPDGKASVTATAGAPLFDTPDGVSSLGSPTATLPLDTLVATDEKAAWNAPDGSPILRVHAGDTSGWTAGSNLRPRDSLAPRVWDTDTGAGVFSPNGDGRQDSIDISATLSESASWKLRVVHGDTTLASRSGTGDTPSMTWAPAAGSVDDGTYTWELEATDALGNGPMAWDGEIDVDTQAPDVTLADAEAATVPWFAPNGDGTRDTIGFAVGSTEPGTIIGSATSESDDVVDTFSASVTSSTTLTWDGRNADGYVADGRYTVTVRARDRAGNQSGAQTRTVDVYGSLGYVASSKTVFYPQDGDSMSRSTVLTFKLASPATVSWRILDAAGQTVRTILADASLDAGTQSFGWDGRNDAGAFVARGTYRSYVAATNGTQSAAQAVSVVADAFKIATSDTTPGRGQRLTVTATTAETLDTVPRLGVYQPGISAWTASMTKVSTGVYRVTITLKSSSSGTLRLKVNATDSGGRSQSSNVYLPLH